MFYVSYYVVEIFFGEAVGFRVEGMRTEPQQCLSVCWLSERILVA